MDQPTLLHPKTFSLKGYLIEIYSFTPLTDYEAAVAAKNAAKKLKAIRLDKPQRRQVAVLK